jgi:hypothetical protein
LCFSDEPTGVPGNLTKARQYFRDLLVPDGEGGAKDVSKTFFGLQMVTSAGTYLQQLVGVENEKTMGQAIEQRDKHWAAAILDAAIEQARDPSVPRRTIPQPAPPPLSRQDSDHALFSPFSFPK